MKRSVVFAVSCIMMLGVFITACDKKDEKKADEKAAASGPVGSCDFKDSEQMCVEYHGGAASKDFVAKECEIKKGKVVDRCPREGVVVRCIRFKDSPQELHEFSYREGYTEETCTATGGEVGEL